MSTTTSRPSPTIENPADAAAQGARTAANALRAHTGGGSLKKFALLSIGAALITILLKSGAYLLTGSVGLLSDALESLVNLAAATMALFLIGVAERPPDEEHTFGHTKAEYFSSGIEGSLIMVAAVGIGWSAWQRLLNPQPLENIGIGLLVAVVASAINLGVALTLLRAGRTYRSITLEADAKHLLTDVYTSAGVIVAVGLVYVTGWLVLDPIIGLLVAINIVWSGVQLVRRSASGLMDTALSAEEVAQIDQTLQPFREQGMEFHALRTRQAGTRRFMSVHVLMPGAWTIQHGHEVADSIETALTQTMPGMVASTHLEPLEDPSSMADQALDRDA